MRARNIAVFCLALTLTLLLQWRGKAYGAEWSGSPDEPAHYITGLMVHDYIVNRLPGSPMAYAQRYYDFYPKVALGHWPPVFYGIQAAWTLIFGISRFSLLVLMAMLGALWLTVSYVVVRASFPGWMAAASVVILASTFDFQASARMVMAEMPEALFTLVALYSLVGYLASGAGRDALRFSFASLLAVLTKGTGIALAPMQILCVAAARKGRLLRSVWFWLPSVLVACVAAVWFLIAPDALHDKVARFGGFGLLRWQRVPETFAHWRDNLGIAGSVFALLGFVTKAWSVIAGREHRGIWIVATIFLPVTLACRILFGPWEVQHLLTTLPLLILFLWEGVEWTVGKIPGHRNAATVAISAALAATAAYHIAKMPAKQHLGIDRVAEDLAATPEYARSRFLILSDAMGEGVFIAEVAAREKRPGHRIERGSKILADESFMGDRTRLFFNTPEDLLSFLAKDPDRIVVIDGMGSNVPVLNQVRETILRYPERWRLLGSYPRAGGVGPIEVLHVVP